MLVHAGPRAIVDAIDRGEAITLPQFSDPSIWEPVVQLADVARRVGAAVVWVTPEEWERGAIAWGRGRWRAITPPSPSP